MIEGTLGKLPSVMGRNQNLYETRGFLLTCVFNETFLTFESFDLPLLLL